MHRAPQRRRGRRGDQGYWFRMTPEPGLARRPTRPRPCSLCSPKHFVLRGHWGGGPSACEPVGDRPPMSVTGLGPWYGLARPASWSTGSSKWFPGPAKQHDPGDHCRSQGNPSRTVSPGPSRPWGGGHPHARMRKGRPPMDAKHEVLRRAQRAGPGPCGSAPKPWLRGHAKPVALISSATSAPLRRSVPDQFLDAAETIGSADHH